MRTTLRLDQDVLDAARQIAAADGRTLGAVMSDLARQALRPTRMRSDGGFPVFDVTDDAPSIGAADVARALDDE